MFNKAEILELELLKLLDSQNKWWTIGELAQVLKVSKITVQSYLTMLKKRVDLLDLEIVFETNMSKGIYFHRPYSLNVQAVYASIIKDSLVYSIINTLLYDSDSTSIKLSRDNFVSIATIRRKYNQINNYLQDFDLIIKKGSLIGDERQLRWFYSDFYWQTFRGGEWPFRQIPQSFVEYLLDSMQEAFQMKIVPEVKEEVTYWITINGIRRLKGGRVSEDVEIKKYALNSPLFPEFIKVLRSIFPNESKKNDPSLPAEMQYLFLLISSLPTMEKHGRYKDMIYEAHEVGETIMFKISQEWLETVESIFKEKIPLEIRKHFVHHLLRIHSFSYLYKMGPSFFLKESYMTDFMISHPDFSNKMNEVFEQLSMKYPSLLRNKTYLRERYNLVAFEYFKNSHPNDYIRISLSFSKGNIYESFIQEKLITLFAGKYNIDFVPYTETKEILITDLAYVIEDKQFEIVSVNSNLTLRDIQNIEKLIQKHVKILGYENCKNYTASLKK